MLRHKGDRTLYKPEYCDVAVGLLEQGYSMEAVAAEIGVTRVTLYNWIKEWPDFAGAVEIGKPKAAKWWEDRAREAATGAADGNPTLIIFGLKNRARHEWRDAAQIEHTGADGGAIKTETKVDLSSAPEDVVRYLAGLNASKS